jgi:nitroreductase/NAD-dependent dihydropyrimidine dehydrogenase PreA subunit
MDIFEVNQETCTKCGACAAICSRGVIGFQEGMYPRTIPSATDFCARCGHCVAICPASSITHTEFPLDECPVIDDSLNISLEQYAQLVKSRRSIRRYLDKPVPREEITRLIDIARFAPTGHNAQEVRWLVVDDRDMLNEFEAVGHDWLRKVSKRDPMMAFVIKRIEAGEPIFIRNAPALVIAHAEKNNPIAAIDSSIALAYFDLAANVNGLGCCWAGFFMMSANTYPPLKKAVKLPDDQRVYGALMLGYPKYRFRRIPRRNPARITWE